MRIFLALVCVAWFGVFVEANAAIFGAGNEPIANFENVSVVARTGAPPSATQVRQAIVAAGANPGEGRQWAFVDAGPNRLIGTLNVRNKHMCTETA